MESIKINIDLPKDKGIYNVSFENNEITVYFDAKFQEYDFLWSNGTFIYRASEDPDYYGCYAGEYTHSKDITINLSNKWSSKEDDTRLATKKEINNFLEKLHEKGKDWDFTNKKLVDYRWRAEKGEHYYSVIINMKGKAVICKEYELNYNYDEERYKNNNYFQTVENAQAIADKINKLFKKNE